jgi:hypothetical protein
MATLISEFTASERRSLAIVAMSIDDIAPEFRADALLLIEKLSSMDEVSLAALADATEAVTLERRAKDLISYLRSERPLIELQSEILKAIDDDPLPM